MSSVSTFFERYGQLPTTPEPAFRSATTRTGGDRWGLSQWSQGRGQWSDVVKALSSLYSAGRNPAPRQSQM